jgi:cell division protein FtsW
MLGLCFLPLVSYLAVHMESYRRERILAFMDPWNASGPAGYHLQQSYMTIASGGTSGAGLGQGPSRNAFLPERHTDFIYAVVCEELGLIGGSLLACAFLALVGLGLFIAFRSRDRFARLIAVGAVMLIGVQAFWNMLVVTGTVPTKGLTLPFISYGGTSMVICLVAIGLVDAVARENIQRVTETSGFRISRIGAGVSTRMRRLRRRSQVV